jgi:hypothetical protein
VWVPNENDRAMFVPLKLGIENTEQIEVVDGMAEGAKFVNVGATAVRNNDQLLYAGAGGGAGRGGRGGRSGQGRGGPGAPGGGAPPRRNDSARRQSGRRSRRSRRRRCAEISGPAS